MSFKEGGGGEKPPGAQIASGSPGGPVLLMTSSSVSFTYM